MSFRKRNVVLSATPAGASPAPGPVDRDTPRQQPLSPRRTTSLTPQQMARGGPVRPTSQSQGRPRPQLLQQPLPDPSGWMVAGRVALDPERRAAVEPVKQRLRSLLEKERQERQERPGKPVPALGRGARPSPFDGRPITSTGTASLDPLLGGYGGLALGHALLVEEQGTTDFASVLLRAYAAEGLVQGHHVHVLGFGHGWKSELPGLPGKKGDKKNDKKSDKVDDKMKIAWRYEGLSTRGRSANGSGSPHASPIATFCHNLDPSKRLVAADISGTLHPASLPNPLLPSPTGPEETHSPLRSFLAGVRTSLETTPPSVLHRVVLPNFLAPTLYALDGWSFPYVVSLLLGLRGLLRAHGRRLSVMAALSTTLYARDDSEGGARPLERLFDNVVELIPLPPGPPSAVAPPTTSTSSSSDTSIKMQGWFKVHKLQVYSETGGAGASPQGHSLRENFCFSMSASRGLEISPYSLPPVDDDSPDKPSGSTAKDGMDF